MATKAYNQKYQNSPAGKVAVTRQYHNSNYAPLESIDDFDGIDLQALWIMQGGCCAACGCELESIRKANIDHISPNSHFNFHFLQLLCERDNQAKKSLVIPFQWFQNNYGMPFYQYFVAYPEQIQEWYGTLWTANDFKRIAKRCAELGLYEAVQ
jgi:hypothetical protein